MQQYFSDYPLKVGEEYYFDNKQAHHAKNVVRLNNEKVRLVHDGIGYFGTCYSKGKDFVAKVISTPTSFTLSSMESTVATKSLPLL